MRSTLDSLADWDRISDAERIDIAKAVEVSLPDVKDIELVPASYGYGVRPQGGKLRFVFDSIKQFALAEQAHTVARFVLGDQPAKAFSLIPGGTRTLGYDRQSRRFPTSDHERQWTQEFGKFTELPPLREQLDQTMTGLRTVTFAPFLIEATTIGLGQDDETPAEHDKVVSGLHEAGFSLPTSDQWEYGYSGGTGCMFPWGDVLWAEYSEIEDSYPCNAFGLMPTTDSYVWELCAESEITRGGDGGGAVCGFGGMLCDLIWACPFFLDMNCERYNGRFRRVLQVPR